MSTLNYIHKSLKNNREDLNSHESNYISKKEKKSLLKWQLLTILGLNLAYVFVISKAFSYYGYFYFEFNPAKILIGTTILLLCLLVGYVINKPFYTSVWNIIFLLLLVGEVIYYQYNPHANIIQAIIVFFCLLFIALLSKVNIKLEAPRKMKNPDSIIGWLCVVIFLPYLEYFKDINLKNLLLIDVYETRETFSNYQSAYRGYTNAILARILLPVLSVIKLEKKQYGMMVLYLVMILYLFLGGALKSIFMGLLAIVFFYKGTYTQKVLRFLKSLSLVIYAGIFVYLISSNTFLLDAFVRRVFFVPPYLGNYYYELFKDNLTYLSHSPFGLGIVDYPYNLPIVQYVGVVMGEPGSSPNIGVITEGLFSFGFLGGVFVALIISLIVFYFHSINIDKKYFGILFIYIYYFNTSLFSTLLLTHGLFFLMVFAYFFLREKNIN